MLATWQHQCKTFIRFLPLNCFSQLNQSCYALSFQPLLSWNSICSDCPVCSPETKPQQQRQQQQCLAMITTVMITITQSIPRRRADRQSQQTTTSRERNVMFSLCPSHIPFPSLLSLSLCHPICIAAQCTVISLQCFVRHCFSPKRPSVCFLLAHHHHHHHHHLQSCHSSFSPTPPALKHL